MLALVLVHTLHLDVKQGRGIHRNAGAFWRRAGQVLLVLQFHLLPGLVKSQVFGKLLQAP